MSDSSSEAGLIAEAFNKLGSSRGSGRPLSGNDDYYRGVLDVLPAAVYITDAAGVITYYNDAAAELWGHHPKLGESRWCGSWKLYWPDGRPMPHDQCPMAMALREGKPNRGLEAIAERPDGVRIPFLPFPVPLFDAAGTLAGAVNMLVDVSDRKHAEDYAGRLAAIVESSDDAIISKDINGIITSWNRGAERLFGYTASEAIGQLVTMLIPPDRPDEEPSILARIRCGEQIDHYETVRQCKDGRLVDVSLTASPVKNADGKVIGASKIARDITEHKRAQEQQRLLLREMNHRIKNLFALAGGMVTVSARYADDPEQLADAVRERLVALSRAHELTLPDLLHERGAEAATSLRTLVETIVSPYDVPQSRGQQRFTIAGADVPVSGGAVTAFALLLHEFATNAAKYGALSSPTGHVDLAWSVTTDELQITWTESGGPRIEGAASVEGFGTLLAQTSIKGQLGGRFTREWRPEGLIIRLSVPLARLTP